MGSLFGSKPAPAPVEIPKVEDTGPAPIDKEAASNAKTREAELKLRKGRGALRVDLASGVGSGGNVGSGISIAS